MAKLSLVPSTSGYSVDDGDEIVRVRLDGGAGRYRKDVIGATRKVSVQWLLKPEDYKYLRMFYSGVARNGARAFTIDLILDEPTLTEHEAHFMPGTLRLAGVQGLRHEVTAELEVVPIARDPDFDESFVVVSDAYTDPCAALNILEVLVNTNAPDATEI